MSALWTSAEAEAATGGRAIGDWAAQGVSIDSRSLTPGDLFIALKDRRDGHDFVEQALKAGAAAALVSRRPEGVSDDAPLLLVDDVLEGLRGLGRAARARARARVIAVTGSVGKTSTKEMLRAALAGQGRVHAAEQSFNNHWGVPLTLARLPREADFAIIEIGMNHAGEITPLSRLAQPHVALVTTVAAAHMAAFDSLADIARAKAEIFAGLAPGGVAVLNRDIETFDILCGAAERAGAKLVTFGESQTADARLEALAIQGQVTTVRGQFSGAPLLFRLGAAGRHFALNALAVLAAVGAAGGDPAMAALGLSAWQAPEGRGARETVMLDPGDSALSLELIDDAYNANPASMAAGLEVLAAAEPVDGIGRVGKGRRLAILTDMLELGEAAPRLHAALAELPALAAVDKVHCAGPLMRHLHEALPAGKRGEWHPQAAELAAQAHKLVDPGDVVLVKGSKGSKASLVVDAIRKLGQAGRN